MPILREKNIHQYTNGIGSLIIGLTSRHVEVKGCPSNGYLCLCCRIDESRKSSLRIVSQSLPRVGTIAGAQWQRTIRSWHRTSQFLVIELQHLTSFDSSARGNQLLNDAAFASCMDIGFFGVSRRSRNEAHRVG